MKKILPVLILLGNILILPSVVSAITIESMVDNIADTVWYVGAAIVVIFWVATGVLFLSALGRPEGISTAKKALFAAIAGTVLVIIAGSAMSIISRAIGA